MEVAQGEVIQMWELLKRELGTARGRSCDPIGDFQIADLFSQLM